MAPFAAAAIVLCVAGVAKLRSPVAAMRVLAALGLPARPWLVRGVACGELSLGAWCLVAPSRFAAAALALLYAAFAGLALVLARRSVSCGCFGDADASPVTFTHSIPSLALASACIAGALWVPHGVSWVLSRSVGVGAALAIGVAGMAYAVVLAYTELPGAWRAWTQHEPWTR